MAKRVFLVIGSGGREHALAWRLSQADDAPVVYVAPGNAGISSDSAITGGCVDIAVDDFEGLAEFAKAKGVTLTVVGPEQPLCGGLVDFFHARNLAVFGPTKAAARLEGSKAFAKDIMSSAGVPTAEYSVFDDVVDALAHVRRAHHPVVIKADGLAGGKGVVIAQNLEESESTLEQFMEHAQYGAASRRVIVEEFLQGPELSFMVITDGQDVVVLPSSQDHKRVGEDDTGPNTGGMGAITPSPWSTEALQEQILTEVIYPSLRELERRGIDYQGFLYAGLMLTKAGPKVLEFNVRLGDPETQALMVAMSGDLGEVLLSAVQGRLAHASLLGGQSACCVVLASRGYPQSPEVGDTISGLSRVGEDSDMKVFHAGTKRNDFGELVTAGGRVLSVTARGSDIEKACAKAYKAVEEISWPGMHYRRDIGRR